MKEEEEKEAMEMNKKRRWRVRGNSLIPRPLARRVYAVLKVWEPDWEGGGEMEVGKATADARVEKGHCEGKV